MVYSNPALSIPLPTSLGKLTVRVFSGAPGENPRLWQGVDSLFSRESVARIEPTFSGVEGVHFALTTAPPKYTKRVQPGELDYHLHCLFCSAWPEVHLFEYC
jgi:hypothetical protein